MNTTEQTLNGPFNTPLESGLRTVILLAALGETVVDLQRLIYYDYLLVHSGDVQDGPQSLHPPTPRRSGEILVRRRLIKDGINLMLSRGLLKPEYMQDGIVYRSSSVTEEFVWYLKSKYAIQLKDRANWVISRFGEMNDGDLSALVNENLGNWGAEFMKDSVLWQADEDA